MTGRRRDPDLVVEVLQRGEDLARIRDQWRGLSLLGDSVFVGPEWFAALDLADGIGAVVVVRRGATVLGVMPFEITGRSVRFAGHRFGDHFAPAASPEDQCEVAAASAAAIARHVPRNHVVLDRVDLGAPWVEAFVGGRATRTARTQLHREPLPYVDLAGKTWTSWLAEQSRNFRGQVGRKERALVREHGAVVRAGGTTTGLGDDLEIFFRLHAARWSVRPGTSALLDARTQALHRRLASALHDEGRLRLRFLEIDGVAVASVYGWSVAGRWSYFNSGWDPRWSPASVGFVLLTACLREAFEEGADTFDLLLGDEPYKSRFASGERLVETVALAHPGSRAHLVSRGELGVRRALEALPPGVDRRLRRAYSSGKAFLAG